MIRVIAKRFLLLFLILTTNVYHHGGVALAIMGNHVVDFHVAPMQCYTNLPFRRLCSSLSPTSTYWTEMEKADDLLPNVKEALMQRLGDPSDTGQKNQEPYKLVLQLGSNDPQKVHECVQAAMALSNEPSSCCYALKEINLNCGCPAIDSGGAPTYGASLMKDPALTASLVDACVQATSQSSSSSLDVSVKCRIGLVEHANDLLPYSSESSLALSSAYDYERLYNYVSKIQQAGANHVILHARPAVLSGLSPVKNRIVPTLQYDMVRQIAKDFFSSQEENLKVTLNGGITSLDQLAAEYDSSGDDSNTSISSFMAGRWILQRPLDLIGIEGWLQQQKAALAEDKTPPPTFSGTTMDAFAIAKGALEDYLDYCCMQCSSSTATRDKTKMAARTTTSDLCLPLFLVIEQLRDDYNDDDDDLEYDYGDHEPSVIKTATSPPLLSYEEMESLYDLLQEGIAELNGCIGKDSGGKKNKKKKNSSDVNFKRLSTSFKSLVGTKVVNKWKRNRAELS